MVWYSHLSQNFPQFIVIHIVKGFGIVNKAEINEKETMETIAKMNKTLHVRKQQLELDMDQQTGSK